MCPAHPPSSTTVVPSAARLGCGTTPELFCPEKQHWWFLTSVVSAAYFPGHSGSIDGKVRLWNIPEQRVVSWQDVHEMVTAVAYSPGGCLL